MVFLKGGGYMVREKTVEKTGRALATLVAVVMWLTGVIVALAVGFGLTQGTLRVPGLSDVVTAAAGWIVVVLTILGVLLAIIERLTA